jgi:hypothetical protein
LERIASIRVFAALALLVARAAGVSLARASTNNITTAAGTGTAVTPATGSRRTR